MTRAARALGRIVLIAAPLLVVGCRADTSGLPTVSVSELAGWLAKGAGMVVCDANGSDVRGEYGIIPGARLLSHFKDYDVAAELPTDKSTQLVFYCASEMCSAAPTAARKAVAQGYSDVHVLPAGIKGWVESEQPVERPLS